MGMYTNSGVDPVMTSSNSDCLYRTLMGYPYRYHLPHAGGPGRFHPGVAILTGWNMAVVVNPGRHDHYPFRRGNNGSPLTRATPPV